MKNLKRVSLLALISILSVSCGKDNSSGGSSRSSSNNVIGNISNNIINNAPQGSTEAFNGLLSWYQGSSEGQLVQTHLLTTYSVPSQSQNQNCNSWLGGFIQFCGSASIGTTTVTSRQRTCFTGQGNTPQFKIASNSNDYYCSSVSSTGTYSKAGNADLAKLVTLNNGTQSLYQAVKEGTRIIVYVGPKTTTTTTNYGNTAPTHMYVIDTKYHSAHNPIEVHDLAAGTIKVKN